MGIRKLGMTIALVGSILGVVATGASVQAEALTIGAAPSLRTALQEMVPMFEKEYGATVQVVYGPSQTMRKQIEQGAAIDVFLPAAVEEVEELQHKGLTLNGGPRIYAQTSLVLVMSATSRVMPVAFHEAQRPGWSWEIQELRRLEKSRSGHSLSSIRRIRVGSSFSKQSMRRIL